MNTALFTTAFLGGLLSFFSPCVLPLIPAYLTFLTGLSTEELQDKPPLSKTLVPALLFVAGFSAIFIALGASASVLGSILKQYQKTITVIGGILVIVFGILMTDLIKIPALYGDTRFDMGKTKGFGRYFAFFTGMAFGAGWTPCIGPILATILAFAASSASVASGTLLLATYSIGLGLPFLAVALLFGFFAPYLKFMSVHASAIKRAAGVILACFGFLIATGLFSRFVQLLSGYIIHG